MSTLVVYERGPQPCNAGVRILKLYGNAVVGSDIVRQWPDAQILYIQSLELRAFPPLPSTLRELTLEGTSLGAIDTPLFLFQLGALTLKKNAYLASIDGFHLPKLRELELLDNPVLTRLPSAIGGSYQLQSLRVEACPLGELPAELNLLNMLRRLYLTQTNVAALPENAARWTAIHDFALSESPYAGDRLDLFHDWKAVRLFHVSATGVRSLPPNLATPALEYVNVSDTGVDFIGPEFTRLDFIFMARGTPLDPVANLRDIEPRLVAVWEAYAFPIIERVFERVGTGRDVDGDLLALNEEEGVAEILSTEFDDFAVANKVAVGKTDAYIVDLFNNAVEPFHDRYMRGYDTQLDELLDKFNTGAGLPNPDAVAARFDDDLAERYRSALETLETTPVLADRIDITYRSNQTKGLFSRRIVENFISYATLLVEASHTMV